MRNPSTENHRIYTLCAASLLLKTGELALAVGRLGAVLALVMMVADVGRNGFDGGVEESGSKRQSGDVLKNVCMLDGLRGRLSPGKGRVAGNKDARNGDGVELILAEATDDDCAGIADIARRRPLRR